MTRKNYFLLCVHSLIDLHGSLNPVTISAMNDAFKIAEDAIPEDVGTAAKEFVDWMRIFWPKPEGKPQWIVDWEQAQQEFVVVRIDSLRFGACNEWWSAAEKLATATTIPRSCWDLFFGTMQTATVPREDADALKEWAEGIPGWAAGPPLTFSKVTL